MEFRHNELVHELIALERGDNEAMTVLLRADFVLTVLAKLGMKYEQMWPVLSTAAGIAINFDHGNLESGRYMRAQLRECIFTLMEVAEESYFYLPAERDEDEPRSSVELDNDGPGDVVPFRPNGDDPA